MSLRIGFDMDGVVADFATAFQDVEMRLFGPAEPGQAPDQPEEEEERHERQLAETRRRRDQSGDEIRKTPDFWTTLKPLGNGSVSRIHALMLAHRWEVFFITQRPATVGETVQRQTQRWLVGAGLRSSQRAPDRRLARDRRRVIPAGLSRRRHAFSTASTSLPTRMPRRFSCRRTPGRSAIVGARKMGIAAASDIEQALDILEQATLAQYESYAPSPAGRARRVEMSGEVPHVSEPAPVEARHSRRAS